MDNRFIYSPSKQAFENLLNAGEISLDSVVYIKKEKLIWAQGHYYADSYTKEELNTILSGKGLNLDKKLLVYLSLTDTSRLIMSFGTDGGVLVLRGDGIGISTDTNDLTYITVKTTGTGLEVTEDGLGLKLGSSLQEGSNGLLVAISSTELDTLALHYDSRGDLSVRAGKGLKISTDTNKSKFISIDTGLGLEMSTSNSSFGIKTGKGLQISEVDNSVEIKLTPYISGQRHSSGLKFDDNNGLQVNIELNYPNQCLRISSDGSLAVSAGDGLIVHSPYRESSYFSVDIGPGLTFNMGGKIVPNITSPISNTMQALYLNDSGEMNVNAGDGLDIFNDYRNHPHITVKVGKGLKKSLMNGTEIKLSADFGENSTINALSIGSDNGLAMYAGKGLLVLLGSSDKFLTLNLDSVSNNALNYGPVGGLALCIGTGLDLHNKDVIVKQGDGIKVSQDKGVEVKISDYTQSEYHNMLSFGQDGGLTAYTGLGLIGVVDNGDAVTSLYLDNSEKNPLHFNDNGALNLTIGSGLEIDEETHAVEVCIGSGLTREGSGCVRLQDGGNIRVNSDNTITVKLTEIDNQVLHANNEGKLQVLIGTGLTTNTSNENIMIVVDPNYMGINVE